MFLVRFTTAVIALQGLQNSAVGELLSLALLPVLGICVYFFATSYATVGYGDVTLPLRWRMHLRFPSTSKPLRALRGKNVTQMHYARKGIITPEMEFIAVRESMRLGQLVQDGAYRPLRSLEALF